MNRIIVAGGTGFIGSHLVKKFLDENHGVFILDANINYFYPLDDFSNQILCLNCKTFF